MYLHAGHTRLLLNSLVPSSSQNISFLNVKDINKKPTFGILFYFFWDKGKVVAWVALRVGKMNLNGPLNEQEEANRSKAISNNKVTDTNNS